LRRGLSLARDAPGGFTWMWVRAANVPAGGLTVVLRSVGLDAWFRGGLAVDYHNPAGALGTVGWGWLKF
jgi:hypothetical protein